MKYKVGDKVRIKNKRTWHMNDAGKMDKYLGTVMTIKEIICDNKYKMIEDNEEWVWNDEDIQGLVCYLKPTKQELLDMPLGTKIYTDKETFNLYVKTGEERFDNEDDENIKERNINEDLTLDISSYGTKIIKIEKPTYETVYDYSTEVQEMTVAEIEEALGHAVKIIKEDN